MTRRRATTCTWRCCGGAAWPPGMWAVPLGSKRTLTESHYLAHNQHLAPAGVLFFFRHTWAARNGRLEPPDHASPHALPHCCLFCSLLQWHNSFERYHNSFEYGRLFGLKAEASLQDGKAAGCKATCASASSRALDNGLCPAFWPLCACPNLNDKGFTGGVTAWQQHIQQQMA